MLLHLIREALWKISVWTAEVAHDLEPWPMWRVLDLSTREKVYVDECDGWAVAEREIARITEAGGQASVTHVTLTNRRARSLPPHMLAGR